MTAPRWPDVYAAILALLPTLPSATGMDIFDGQPLDNTSWKYVTVGFVTDDGAGSFRQQRDPSGFATQEAGDVICKVGFNAGDDSPTITRGLAFALVGDWQTAFERDQTFGGLLGADSTLDLSAQVLAVKDPQGTATELLVTVTYTCVTYFTA